MNGNENKGLWKCVIFLLANYLFRKRIKVDTPMKVTSENVFLGAKKLAWFEDDGLQ